MEHATITEQGGESYRIRILSISEQELNDTWDRVEKELGGYYGSPWYGRPSEYLLRAYRLKLITWDQALEMCMASMGVGCTDP